MRVNAKYMLLFGFVLILGCKDSCTFSDKVINNIHVTRTWQNPPNGTITVGLVKRVTFIEVEYYVQSFVEFEEGHTLLFLSPKVDKYQLRFEINKINYIYHKGPYLSDVIIRCGCV